MRNLKVGKDCSKRLAQLDSSMGMIFSLTFKQMVRKPKRVNGNK